MDFDKYTEDNADKLEDWFDDVDTPENNIIFNYMFHHISLLEAKEELVDQFAEIETTRYEDLVATNPSAPYEHDGGLSYLTDLFLEVLMPLAIKFNGTNGPQIALLKALKPSFGAQVLEHALHLRLDALWNGHGTTSAGFEDPSEDVYKWYSLNNYIGIAHQEGLLDTTSYAFDTLDMALRKGGWLMKRCFVTESSCPHEFEKYWVIVPEDNIEALKAHFCGAEQLIMGYGGLFYKDSKEIRDRWSQWTENLEWILEQDVDAETKDKGSGVLEKMKKIEQAFVLENVAVSV